MASQGALSTVALQMHFLRKSCGPLVCEEGSEEGEPSGNYSMICLFLLLHFSLQRLTWKALPKLHLCMVMTAWDSWGTQCWN